jgi:hypothetical protein
MKKHHRLLSTATVTLTASAYALSFATTPAHGAHGPAGSRHVADRAVYAAPTAGARLGAEEEGNTGVSSRTVPLQALSKSRSAQLAAKFSEIDELAEQMRAEAAATASAEPNASGDDQVAAFDDPQTIPQDYEIPAARQMTIHAQNKSYTCGPASLRNMVLVMNKVNTGSYMAKSEATYEDWLGTTTDGTAIGSIVNVLNNQYSHFGSWGLANPSDKWAFMSSVVTNSYRYKQPLIQGVRTRHLPYFEGRDLHHFNFSYGYQRSTSTKRVSVGEVWNPEKVYGSSDYNPYGHRAPALADLFLANDVSCPNCSDRRRLIV